MTLAHDPTSHFKIDQIAISGITATGRHGVLSSERESGQEFIVDLILGLALGDAAAGDDLDKTVNYAHLAEAAVSVIEGPAVNLIETLAERIAAVTLENQLVESVSVSIHKPHAPIPVPFGSVAVTVHRSRTNPARVSRPFAVEDAPAVAALPRWQDVDSPSSPTELDSAPGVEPETATTPVSAVATAFAAPVVASVSPSVAVSPAPIPTSDSVASAQEAFHGSETASGRGVTPSDEVVEPTGEEDTSLEAVEEFPAEAVADTRDEPTQSDENGAEEPAGVASAQSPLVAETHSADETPVAAEQTASAADTEPSHPDEISEAPVGQSVVEPTVVPTLEEDLPALPEPQVGETALDSVDAAITTHAVPVVEHVPAAADIPVVDQASVADDSAETVVSPALEGEPEEEASTHTTQFAALSESLGVSDASGYPWHQAQSNTVPLGPTLSELLGGSQDEPLDLSKPLFAMGTPKELPPLPKPFFEAAATKTNAPVVSAQNRTTAPEAPSVTQTSAQSPEVSGAPAADQNEWAPPVFAFDTPETQPTEPEPLPSRPESAQSAHTSNSALSPETPRSAPSASSSNDSEPAPPISAAGPAQSVAAETAPGDEPQADSSSSMETEHTTTLSPSAQQRLEERFAAMMSEHFDIDVKAGNRGGDSPQVAAENGAAGQASAASADEPATTVSAIPLVASQPTQSQEASGASASSPSAESPAPSSDDAPTQVIPVIVPDDPQEDLSRGGTAIIEPASRPERASALSAEASLNTSMFKTLDQMDEIPQEPVRVVLALGANLGDAQATLNAAVKALGETEGFTIVKVGPLALTAAVGGPEQNDYYNSVVIGETTLSPRELLHATQAIENAHNRTREVHWGPRTIDIDIITYGMLVASAEDLELPHPRAKERAFVLVPWEEADHEAVLPGLGGGPVSALAATAPDRSGVRWLALNWLT